MAYAQIPHQYYANDSHEVGIPEMLVSASATEQIMPPSTTTIKTVTSQSGSQGPNGQMSFNVGTGLGQGYLKPGVSFRCKLKVEQVKADNNIWGFAGSSAQSVADYTPSALPGSGSSLINKVSVYIGGILVSQINRYDILHRIALTHASSKEYATDAALYESNKIAYTNKANASDDDTTVFLNLPLLNSIFSNEQAVPLFLLNSPITVEITFNSVANALYSAPAGNPITGFTVSDASLVYEVLNVDSSLEQAVKSKVMGGSVWSSYLDEFYGIQVASSAALSYNVGLGLSSVKGVLLTNIKNSDLTVDKRKALSWNGMTSLKVLLDSRQVNNDLLNDQAIVFSELKRTLNSLFDYSSTSDLVINPDPTAPAAPKSDFVNEKYVCAVNTNRCNSTGFAMTGSPCQNLSFEMLSSATADQARWPGGVAYTDAQTFCFVLYSQRITIDGTGAVSISR